MLPINLPKKPNIQGFWKLEEANANRIDQSANANTLTDNNTVDRIAAKIGYGANLVKANSEYLSRAVAGCVGINNSTFTITGWIKHATGTLEALISGSSAGNRQIQIETDNKLTLAKQGVTTVGTSTDAIGNNVLTHFGVSYDGTNWAFYISGAASGSGTNAQTLVYGDFYVGRQATTYINAVVDELIVWNVILTPAEVLQVKNISNYSYGGLLPFFMSMREAYDNNKKLWTPKGLILPKDLGFQM